jgi:hypothetical protein
MHGVQTPGLDNQLRAKQIFSKTVEQDKELRNLSKKKSAFDRSISALRNNIRDNYEQIIFLDYDFAVSKDVEQSIWKTVFYRVIEEYRKKLRKCASMDDKDSPTSKDEVRRVQASFRNFLGSAANFYQQLLQKLQQAFHLVLDGSISYNVGDAEPAQHSSPYSPHSQTAQQTQHKSYLSCHRCFIFLGDLARYHKDIQDDFANDLKNAEMYYKQALQLVPDNGNPHNQLAVLATYSDDELSAVFRYFRSLAVKQPFATARDNLFVLFEKNKARLATLTKDLSTNEGPKPITPGYVQLLLCRYIRLHGLLFTKTALDSFGELKGQVTGMMRVCISSGTGVLDPPTVLKLAAIAIFSVHNAKASTNKSSYAEASQRSIIQNLALSFVLEVATIIMRDSKYFGVLWIIMEWLRVHPEYLKLPEAEADVQIWESFWDTLAKAVNHYNAHKTNTSSLPIPSYLPEEAELRGFRPLFLAFRSLPPFVFVQPIPIDDQPVTPVSMGSPSLLMYRVQKICEFAVLASRQQPKLLYVDPSTGFYSAFPPTSAKHHFTPPSIIVSNTKTEQVQQQAEGSQEEEEEDEEEEDDDNDIDQKAGQYEFVSSPEDEVYIPPIVHRKTADEDVTILSAKTPNMKSGSMGSTADDDDGVDDEVILFRPPGSDIDQKIEATASHSHHHPVVGIIGEKPVTPPAPASASVAPLFATVPSSTTNNNSASMFNGSTSLFSLHPFNAVPSSSFGTKSSPSHVMAPSPVAAESSTSNTNSMASLWSSSPATSSYSLFAGRESMPAIDRPFQQPQPLVSSQQQQAANTRSHTYTSPGGVGLGLGTAPQAGPLDWLRSPVPYVPTYATTVPPQQQMHLQQMHPQQIQRQSPYPPQQQQPNNNSHDGNNVLPLPFPGATAAPPKQSQQQQPQPPPPQYRTKNPFITT